MGWRGVMRMGVFSFLMQENLARRKKIDPLSALPEGAFWCVSLSPILPGKPSRPPRLNFPIYIFPNPLYNDSIKFVPFE